VVVEQPDPRDEDPAYLGARAGRNRRCRGSIGGMELPMTFNIELPPEKAEGHYADFANVWHGKETFILDFAATVRPPQKVEDESGTPVSTRLDARVVTRVRIPASQCFELMKALEKQLSQWEKERGV
jgi:hypothetical protein